MIPVIDVLKVDRSLLSGDEGDQRALQDIVDLARARNVEISAEGVENAAQHSLVVGQRLQLRPGLLLRAADPRGAGAEDARLLGAVPPA